MWCGVVWCGVVWCGVVWCGVVWCGVVVSLLNAIRGGGVVVGFVVIWVCLDLSEKRPSIAGDGERR